MTPKQKNLALRIEAERLDRRNVSLGWQTSGAQLAYLETLPEQKPKMKFFPPIPLQRQWLEGDFEPFGAPADPYAELKAAQAAGKIIEAQNRNNPGAEWLAIRANFDSDVMEYRVKPD